ncbi:MAG: energy-coupling factor ABC transporter permease [Thermoplasmata archaeon]|nr:energy-coupling factor ABC transporter permease [Thermoplasmata archaeon]
MAHVHLEDGAFSLEWVIIWGLIAAALVAFALYRLGGKLPTRKMAIAAMCVAVGIVIFQVEIPVFGGLHINLTPLMGILVGPGLGTLVVLIINIFSAAIGHGGWGMIGPNAIVNVTEVLLGYYLYRLCRTRLKAGRFTSGFSAATVALTVSALLVVVIVSISGLQDSTQTTEETFANMLLLAAANIVTGVIEGFVTGYIVSFVGKIRPDLLQDAEGPKGPEDEEESMTESAAGV